MAGERPEIRRVDLRSTGDSPATQVFDRWEAELSEAYVPLAISPSGTGDFRAWIEHGRYDGVELSTLGSTRQRVHRTDRLIARTAGEFLHTSIQIAGRGRLHQDGRVADVGPGAMVFYDSTRPYHWEFDSDWEMAAVQVPAATLHERLGLTLREIPTALIIAPGTPAGLVADYFRELTDLQSRAPEQARALADSAVDLLTSAISLTRRQALPSDAVRSLAARRVMEYMRAHCTDPDLTVDRIAEGCAISRRTVYRVFDGFDGGPAAILRGLRVEHACTLIRNRPGLPLAAVARASGFQVERQFYRAFRVEKGMTPSEFRLLR